MISYSSFHINTLSFELFCLECYTQIKGCAGTLAEVKKCPSCGEPVPKYLRDKLKALAKKEDIPKPVEETFALKIVLERE